ncbi:FUSC family protein [Catenulispora sp. MAP5-51]|uniref:FUSC family protein n=1 Tax=Catenulispora sp. MAP5-51 TaxID=3156298 RepID=UPI003513DA1C
MPAVFAVAFTVIGNPVLATFAAFGSFATMSFVDFTGTTRERLTSQAGLVVVGAVLVIVGTLASQHIWLAVLVTFVIGFTVFFAGVVSSALASATNALLLSFVLAVTLPGPPSAISDRVLGWLLAGGASLVAIVLLWPAPIREPLRSPTVKACRLTARRLRAGTGRMRGGFDPQGLQARRAAADAAGKAVADLRNAFFRTPYRPTGLTTSARILVRLVDQVIWLESILERMPADAGQGPTDEAVTRVELAAADVLDQVADVLQTGSATGGELAAGLHELRSARTAMEQLTTETLPIQHSAAMLAAQAGAGPARAAAEFVADLTPSFRAQELTSAVTAIATTAELAVADRARTEWQRVTGGKIPDAVGSPIASARERAAAHVEIHSVWLRNSLRGAAALALAVSVVEISDVEHAFWVVLGALSVLRSNALTTGQNVLRAVAGTAVGIVVGGALVYFLGAHTSVLWALLPIAVFFGGIAPSVISFAAGQAGFTATVLILYNLIEPAGWQIGIVRVEDVVIGCAVSLVVGLLFWPRGAASALSRSLSEALSDSARYLGKAVDYGVSRCDRVPISESLPAGEARRAAAASRRLDDAFRNYLAERGTKRLPLADLTTLLNAVAELRLTGDAVLDLWSTVGRRPEGDRAQARREVRGTAGQMTEWFGQASEALLGEGEPPRPAGVDQASGTRLVAALGRDLDGDNERGAAAAVRMIWTAQHVETARYLEVGVAGPVDKIFANLRAHGGGLPLLRASTQSASA